jgi:cytochrome b pre-mRNA-processing protein 3
LFAISSNNATDLALVVQYIRRELQALEKYGGENLNAGIVKFDKPDATFV